MFGFIRQMFFLCNDHYYDDLKGQNFRQVHLIFVHVSRPSVLVLAVCFNKKAFNDFRFFCQNTELCRMLLVKSKLSFLVYSVCR